MAFNGFPRAGLTLLEGLAQNNDRDWFEANRAAWDSEIIPSLLSLCEALTGRLRPLMPGLVFVPRVGGSVMRLNRDVRFSRDKRPYKTQAAALLWEGGEKHACPSVYLHVAPGEVVFGGGMVEFEEGRLDRYRKLCLSEGAGERLQVALAAATRGGHRVEGEKIARVPRGVDPEHARAELFKHKGLYVNKTQKPGAWLHTEELLDRAEAAARSYAPLHAWLRDELCSSKPIREG